MARWLGIDHGTKRIGLAIGDDGGGPVSPIEQLDADDPQLAAKILGLADDYAAAGAVVGWPINADGSEGPQAILARAFATDLAEATGLDVRLWDERLSSFEADERLRGTFTRKQKKRRQDSIAASVFLSDFLAAGGAASGPKAGDAVAQLDPPEEP